MQALFRYFKSLAVLGLVLVSPSYTMDVSPNSQESIASDIFSYNNERDHRFITNLLAHDPYNFPDADKVADLDNEYTEMVMPYGQLKIKQNIFVYCINARPVGFIRIFDFANDVTRGTPDGSGMIAQIAIAEQYRRMGIGEKLLIHGITQLRAAGIGIILLDTMANNHGAHALYEKVGFQKLVDGCSHYLYCLHLIK